MYPQESTITVGSFGKALHVHPKNRCLPRSCGADDDVEGAFFEDKILVHTKSEDASRRGDGTVNGLVGPSKVGFATAYLVGVL